MKLDKIDRDKTADWKSGIKNAQLALDFCVRLLDFSLYPNPVSDAECEFSSHSLAEFENKLRDFPGKKGENAKVKINKSRDFPGNKGENAKGEKSSTKAFWQGK